MQSEAQLKKVRAYKKKGVGYIGYYSVDHVIIRHDSYYLMTHFATSCASKENSVPRSESLNFWLAAEGKTGIGKHT